MIFQNFQNLNKTRTNVVHKNVKVVMRLEGFKVKT